MPYKRKDDYRENHAAWYSEKYRTEKEFRDAESKRKAEWYALKASDPAWLARQALKKRVERALGK
jgi:hypothetical protein